MSHCSGIELVLASHGGLMSTPVQQPAEGGVLPVAMTFDYDTRC